ncbi:hypothetical protein [Helicobacter canis]|uniref:Uncharacterized protein n=1 Tax=Helicobacter canis NCTC 12740 TaxID=1357399 RepID=V8CJ21_9HELI|nr:hypothetical protein [Helicobacter canis]ETD27359.1 hypothetical protein HMPREF2087_00271 [Helicobacter canis NCTC 12740]
MINLQHHIKGNNINQSFVSWCKKLEVRFGYIKVQGEHRAYHAKAMERVELEKFIQKARERVRNQPSLNSDTEAGLLSLLRILERALKLAGGVQ